MPDDPRAPRRLRILTWQVHGNYLWYLSQLPHDFHLVVKPGDPPGYAGPVGALPWGTNVKSVPIDEVSSGDFDCVIYQSRQHWDHDRLQVLSPAQRELPTLYIEHDAPREQACESRHFMNDPDVLLVHVTPFNALMWNSPDVPTTVIEHGVSLLADARYSGELRRGVVAINEPERRGRTVGADLYRQVRASVPLTLVGMGTAQMPDGAGEVPNPLLPTFMSRFRFFFYPVRWTSLGLTMIEAMMVGLPIIGLATTELVTVVRNGENGWVDTRVDRLIDVMNLLLADRPLAEDWGRQARHDALARFGIDRFIEDWSRALVTVMR